MLLIYIFAVLRRDTHKDPIYCHIKTCHKSYYEHFHCIDYFLLHSFIRIRDRRLVDTFVFAQCCPHLVLNSQQQTLPAVDVLAPEHHGQLPAGALLAHAGLGQAEPRHGHGGVQSRLCYTAHFV